MAQSNARPEQSLVEILNRTGVDLASDFGQIPLSLLASHPQPPQAFRTYFGGAFTPITVRSYSLGPNADVE